MDDGLGVDFMDAKHLASHGAIFAADEIPASAFLHPVSQAVASTGASFIEPCWHLEQANSHSTNIRSGPNTTCTAPAPEPAASSLKADTTRSMPGRPSTSVATMVLPKLS